MSVRERRWGVKWSVNEDGNGEKRRYCGVMGVLYSFPSLTSLLESVTAIYISVFCIRRVGGREEKEEKEEVREEEGWIEKKEEKDRKKEREKEEEGEEKEKERKKE